MCGLYGVIGRGIDNKVLAAYRDLLWIGALRGTDSTGTMFGRTLRKDPKLVLKKYKYDSPQFLYDYRGFLSDPSWNILMGHCRSATVGEITDKNSHPFDVGSLVGAHNGTLVGTEFKSPNKTDSELLFEKIQKIGLKESLESLTRWDAYAISVYDKQTRVVTLARNDQRPLYIARGNKQDVLFWGSEWRMLELALARNGVDADIMSLAVDTIHEFKIDEIHVDNKNPYTQIGLNVSDDIPWSNYGVWR